VNLAEDEFRRHVFGTALERATRAGLARNAAAALRREVRS
jgi:hypothetical protein